MSRRKRGSVQREARPQGGSAGRGTPPAPVPSPPRPNKGFLLIAALLLAGWVIFLAVLVVATLSPS